MCTLWVVFDFCCCTISMLHLCLVAHDRYIALVCPYSSLSLDFFTTLKKYATGILCLPLSLRARTMPKSRNFTEFGSAFWCMILYVQLGQLPTSPKLCLVGYFDRTGLNHLELSMMTLKVVVTLDLRQKLNIFTNIKITI